MFFNKEKLSTAVDISDGLLKVAAIYRDKGEDYLHTLDTMSLPLDDKEIAREIRSLIAKHKLWKSSFYVSFPRHLVTIRTVRLPTTNEEEVKNMAGLQAVKFLPYAREEMIVAHKTIDVTKDGYTDILLILAQKKSIDRYLKIFKNAAIAIEKVALSSEGLLGWYSRLKIDDTQPVAIIDVDRLHTHIQVVKDGKLLFTRSVSLDIEDFHKSKAALLTEISLSFDTFLKESGERVSRLILSGCENYIKNVSDFLRENLAIPLDQAEQLRRIKIKESASKLVNQLKDGSYAHLLGIVFNPESLEINLLPYAIIDKKRELRLRQELIKTSLLFLAVLTAAGGIINKKIDDKKNYLRDIDSRLKEMEPEVKNLSTLKKNIELIQNQITLKGSAIDILRELYSILPQDVSLTLLEFEGSSRILLRGTARELSKVFDMLTILEKSDFFENVKINFATKRSFKNMEFADFEIVCSLH